MEQKEPDIMRIKPRRPRTDYHPRSLGAHRHPGHGRDLCHTGCVRHQPEHSETDPANPILSQTIAFTTLVVAELLRAFTARSERFNLWQIGLLTNRWMAYAVAASFALLVAVIYLPFLQPVFSTVPLSLEHWLMLLPFTLLPSAAAEIAKFFLRRRSYVRRLRRAPHKNARRSFDRRARLFPGHSRVYRRTTSPQYSHAIWLMVRVIGVVNAPPHDGQEPARVLHTVPGHQRDLHRPFLFDLAALGPFDLLGIPVRVHHSALDFQVVGLPGPRTENSNVNHVLAPKRPFLSRSPC
jgi:hypothetical protein